MIETRKREHSRKPDEQYTDHRGVLVRPVPGAVRPLSPAGLDAWGDEAGVDVVPRGRQHPMYRG